MSINQFAATATFEADPTWDDRRGLEVSPPLLDSLPQSRLMLSLGAPPPMDGGDGPLHAWKNQSVYISSKYHLDRSDEDKADSNYRFELKLGLVSLISSTFCCITPRAVLITRLPTDCKTSFPVNPPAKPAPPPLSSCFCFRSSSASWASSFAVCILTAPLRSATSCL